MSSQLYAPAALTWGRRPHNEFIKTLGGGGTQSQSGWSGKEFIFLTLLRIHPRFVSSVRGLITALTEISRLHNGIYFGILSLCVCVFKLSSMVSYQLLLQTDINGWTKVDQTIW